MKVGVDNGAEGGCEIVEGLAHEGLRSAYVGRLEMIEGKTTSSLSSGCVASTADYRLAMLFDRSGATYIGNLGPVPLYIHPSAFFLIILTFLLFPGADIPTYVMLLVILVMAIVLHEMGHGFMARAFGAQGVTITLTATGGVCSSYRERDQYGSEMMILAAGPAVSFALWGLSVGASEFLEANHNGMLESESGPTLLARFLNLNGIINFWLGIFNSLPIYPLDGGQFIFNGLRLARVRWQLTHQVCFYTSALFVAGVLAWQLTQLEDQITTGFIWLTLLLGYALYNAYVYLMQR